MKLSLTMAETKWNPKDYEKEHYLKKKCLVRKERHRSNQLSLLKSLSSLFVVSFSAIFFFFMIRNKNDFKFEREGEVIKKKIYKTPILQFHGYIIQNALF